MCCVRTIRKAKPIGKWGRKATGPRKPGSRVARSDHCMVKEATPAFFLAFFETALTLGTFLMKEALVPVHIQTMVPVRGETSMALTTNKAGQGREGLRRMSSSGHGIARRLRVNWIQSPGPRITGELIDIYA